MTNQPYGGRWRKTDAQNLADAVELMLPHIRTVADMGAHIRAMAAELHRLDEANQELLEALKAIVSIDAHSALTEKDADAIQARARAAIAKHGGNHA